MQVGCVRHQRDQTGVRTLCKALCEREREGSVCPGFSAGNCSMEALLKRREMKELAPGKEQEELLYTVRQDDLAGAPTDKMRSSA